MGLAVSMLSDPGWRNILKEEDAESYMKVYRWGHGLGEVGWGGVEWGGMPIRKRVEGWGLESEEVSSHALLELKSQLSRLGGIITLLL